MYLLACCSVNSMRGVIDSFDAETVCMTAMQNSIGILCAEGLHVQLVGIVLVRVVSYAW